jgi:hypothetical protein
MITIVNKNTGEVLGGTIVDVTLNENEISINELLTESYVKPYFNFETRTFYEGATQEEINEANRALVPQEVQLWRIRTVLKLMQLETQIESAIETMPEPSKTAATYIWKYGTTVERTSQTVLLLQSIIQLTDEQVDDLFIQADAILL